MPDKFANLQVMPGRAYPMGTAVYDEGVRFAVFSRHATRVWLALFERVEDLEPAWEYEFDPHRNRANFMLSFSSLVFMANIFFFTYRHSRRGRVWS